MERNVAWAAALAVCAACSQGAEPQLPVPTGTGGGSSGGAETSTGTTAAETGPADPPATTSGGGDSSSSSGESVDPTWDPPVIPDAPGTGPCDGGDSEVEFSYIWIANSPEGTVSKIDTQGLVEVGRYITRPDGNGDPSRTSVNLQGDVAIANRNGGLTKITAWTKDCPDPDNTSTGPDDVKPWQDGCIAWHIPMTYTSQRPVAWTQGEFDPDTCTYSNAKVWTAGASVATGIEVTLVDGDTGVVDEVIPVPEVPLGLYNFGLYGAAVDGEGNFWASQLEQGYLVRVDFEDHEVSQWPMPISGYGMTVDSMGRPWTCNVGVARFDPSTEDWTIGEAMPGYGGGGCMEDGEGRIWVGGYSLMAIDVEEMTEIDAFPLPVIGGNPDTGYGRGVSIDFEGYVWSPAYWADAAYRLDPDSGEFESVDGLNRPYTYSDMTGFQLKHAGTAPE